MPYELLIYILVVMIAGVLSSILCVYALLRLKDAPGAKPYILVTLFSAIFTFSYAYELSSRSLEEMVFWLSAEYLVLPFIPVFILLMCLEYVGHKLKQRMYYILFTIPILTLFMHGTNEYHHLYYTSLELNADSPFPILKLEHGPWFYVHSIFLFLCLMMSIIVLLMDLKKTKVFRFRMQIILMVAGISLPIIANYFYINELSPYGIDLGPVSMSISLIFHGAALLSYQMFNVTPVARDTVFENMKDGVIVLNQKGIIVDYNQAMMDVIPTLNPQYIGKTIVDVAGGKGQLAEIFLYEKECDYEMCIDGGKTFYHIRFSDVVNKNKSGIGKIITFVDVTERVELQQKLKTLASVDGLTQVYNRTFFTRESERIIESLIRSGGNVSIMMFDIDHFKNVNDTFGHEAGDRVLIHVANLAKESLRPIDIIGRYGGEEFIICLPNTTLLEANEMAHSIRLKIAESPIRFEDNEVRVTSSFGISSAQMITGDYHQLLQKLMREADHALYTAKRNGRNDVVVYKQAFDCVN